MLAPQTNRAVEAFDDIREAVRALCVQFPGEYWRKLDRERVYPTDFVNALTSAGFLAALIPEDYGGSGLTMTVCTENSGSDVLVVPIGAHDARDRGVAGEPFLLDQQFERPEAAAAGRDLEHPGLGALVVEDGPDGKALQQRAAGVVFGKLRGRGRTRIVRTRTRIARPRAAKTTLTKPGTPAGPGLRQLCGRR
jgi:alkylation response protein AidB-like acyl-CoA dehydrogenase